MWGVDSHPVLIELGAVLIGLSVLARVAGLLRIPAIPLYLLAGLAFGRGGVLPLVTTTEFIEIGAEIGLILLLFSLGLEYSARELVTTLRQQAPAGLLDATMNFLPGVAAGLLLGWEPVPAAVLGGITYVSSSGIAAKLLHDFKWTSRPESRVVLSLLVLEDLAMAVYLPILAGLLVVGGFNMEALLVSAAGVLAVIVLLALALRVDVGLTRFIFSHSDEALLLTILGLAIFVAGVAELVQISAAVGALIVGIVMSGPGIAGARELLTPLRDFFAAMFFAFFGLTINPADLPSVLGAAFALAAVTAATKFAAGWLIGRRSELEPRERVRVGALLVARGEFSIVIAALATASGFGDVGPLAAAYVLILAVVGPVAARIAIRSEGTRKPPTDTLGGYPDPSHRGRT